MRIKLLTLWAVVLMGAFGAIVQGKVAVMMEEPEMSPLAKLYSQSISPQTSLDMAELRREAKKLYQEGKCVGAEDLYRLASVLTQSNDPADLLLAHDCALASLIEGFRPSAKALRTCQKQILRSIGFGNESQASVRRESKAATVRLLEQFESSWSAAANSASRDLPGTVALAVAE